MIKDNLVEFAGHRFECVDKDFGQDVPVDVVIRPEDIYLFELSDAAQFSAQVTSSIFKGVHYEMMVMTPEGYEFMIQDYHCFEVGKTVGLRVKPSDIHVMKKERLTNRFEGTIVDKSHVRFLRHTFNCPAAVNFAVGSKVKVSVGFGDVVLQDNEDEGEFPGSVSFILYKGNHYHLTVLTDDNENIFVNTNDIWDDGDRVGITIAPESIQLSNL
jgi:spermidine/putrescine transport system ATP-binding protein